MKHIKNIGLVALVLGCTVFRSTAQLAPSDNENLQYDAIIVPGIPHDGKTWNPLMNHRVAWSVYLYKTGVTKNIIYSGSAVYSPYNEAKTMALYAQALGVPAEHIFLDTVAEHSTENVYYSYQVAKSIGSEKIALTTDPFQNRMVGSFIRKHRLPIDRLPFNYQSLEEWNVEEPEISLGKAINPRFISIKKQEGFFKRLAGTFGANIKWREIDLPTKRLIKKYKKRGRLLITSDAE